MSAEIDRGPLTLHPDPCEVRELVASAIDAARLHAPHGVELRLDAPDEVTITADAGKLRQVVVNLLDNAIKYSPDGGMITLTVSGRPQAVTIAVADQGLGIPAEARERIFEKFVRLDPGMRCGVGGSGLGLYISRELVERMGVTLRVSSNGSVGSTFTVELPAHWWAPAAARSGHEVPARITAVSDPWSCSSTVPRRSPLRAARRTSSKSVSHASNPTPWCRRFAS